MDDEHQFASAEYLIVRVELSGPAMCAIQPPAVSVSCVEIDRLWMMEEFLEVTKTLPDFRIDRCGTFYQVGLLWRSKKPPPPPRQPQPSDGSGGSATEAVGEQRSADSV